MNIQKVGMKESKRRQLHIFWVEWLLEEVTDSGKRLCVREEEKVSLGGTSVWSTFGFQRKAILREGFTSIGSVLIVGNCGQQIMLRI